MASGANHSRLTFMTYPNGRVLHYGFSSGLDSDISRVSFLADDNGSGSPGTHVEEYTYLGVGTIVRKNRPEPGVELTFIKQGLESTGDAGDQYNGLDRFGRIADQRWLVTSSGSSGTVDRFTFAYDRNSNPLYKKNELSAAMSELYHANSSTSGDDNTAYDKLNRLTDFRRGTLSSSSNNGSGGSALDTVTTASRTQNWDMDALGNSDSVTSDGTPQSRTHNSKNQATVVGGNSLAFDDAGNTKTDESGKQHVYDAWNRLVESKASAGAGGASLVTHAYDALRRRVIESPNGGTATDLYHTANWQVIEERQTATTKAQYVWGLGYIDDLILRDKDADSSGGTGSYGKSGSGLEERLYAQQDANHNITALVTAGGTVVQRFVYDPYGVATVLDASWSGTTDGYNWHYRHQGTRWEANAGLYDVRNRFYSPTLMRWMQEDPKGYVDGANQYEVLNVNPVNNIDPLGLTVEEREFWRYLRDQGRDHWENNDENKYKIELLEKLIQYNEWKEYDWCTTGKTKQQMYNYDQEMKYRDLLRDHGFNIDLASGFVVLESRIAGEGSDAATANSLGGHADVFYKGQLLRVGLGGGAGRMKQDALKDPRLYLSEHTRAYLLRRGKLRYKLEAGKAKGKAVKDATDEELADSIANYPKLNSGSGTWNNCQTDIENATYGAGLEGYRSTNYYFIGGDGNKSENLKLKEFMSDDLRWG